MRRLIGLDDFQIYKDAFCWGSFGVPGGFGIRYPDGEWNRQERAIRDNDIEAHLNGIYWIQVRPIPFPVFAALDFDNKGFTPVGSSTFHDAIFLHLYEMGIRGAQFLPFSSPSFGVSGDCHVYIRPVYNGSHAPLSILQRLMVPIAKRIGAEFFPHTNELFRAPLGRGQHLLDPATFAPLSFSWQECMRFFIDMEPFEINELYRLFSPISTSKFVNHKNMPDTEHLFDELVEAPGSQFRVVGSLGRQFYREGLPLNAAKERVIATIGEKTHGRLEYEDPPAWGRIVNMIERLLEATYSWCAKKGIGIGSAMRSPIWVTQNDLFTICKTFPGDLINQKRFFKLIALYRAKIDGALGFAEISNFAWKRIARSGYKKFQKALLDRRMMIVNDSYMAREQIGYSKKFSLAIEEASPSDMITEKGAAISEYRKAMRSAFGSRYATLISGCSPRAFNESSRGTDDAS